jgi:site-specific DNA recombinase
LGIEDAVQEEGDQLIIPWIKPSAHRTKMLMGQTEGTAGLRPMGSQPRARLLKAVAQGRIWLDSLVGSKSESIPSIATKQGVSEKTVRSTLSLALLAPDIIGAAIEGRLPRGITVTELTDLPADWVEQHKCLGLA